MILSPQLLLMNNMKIKVPGSKSITNRALLIASLAKGRSYLRGVLHSEDTQWMIKICRQLGAKIEVGETPEILQIDGCGGRFATSDEELYIGNSGTCARFLTAALLMGQGCYVLRGNPRMQERPMSELLAALRAWGARIECMDREGYLPLRIHAQSGLRGGSITISGDRSSQFTSALLMLAPMLQDGATVHVQGEAVSASYVTMTTALMEIFGVQTQKIEDSTYNIPGSQTYEARDFLISADASSASYFFALAAIRAWTIRVQGLLAEPLQSDYGFVFLLESMGCAIWSENNDVIVQGPSKLRGIDVDMRDMSDVVPTLAIVALFAESPTHIRHVHHMRFKECDRISALCKELRKLGASVEEFADGLRIDPLEVFPTPTDEIFIHTYDDHRIAMAFGILAQRIPQIRLEDPTCVAKTYPTFFEDLEKVNQQLILKR